LNPKNKAKENKQNLDGYTEKTRRMSEQSQLSQESQFRSSTTTTTPLHLPPKSLEKEKKKKKTSQMKRLKWRLTNWETGNNVIKRLLHWHSSTNFTFTAQSHDPLYNRFEGFTSYWTWRRDFTRSTGPITIEFTNPEYVPEPPSNKNNERSWQNIHISEHIQTEVFSIGNFQRGEREGDFLLRGNRQKTFLSKRLIFCRNGSRHFARFSHFSNQYCFSRENWWFTLKVPSKAPQTLKKTRKKFVR